MRHAGTLAALLVALSPGSAAADRLDLDVLRLEGLITPRTPALLEAAARRTSARGRGMLLVVDSPGGDLESAQKAMLAILFADVPVVGWIPPGGQAAGAAVLPLLGCSTIAVAPTAHLGSRKGL